MIPLLSPRLDQDQPGEHPRQEGNAQIDKDALGNFPHRDIDQASCHAEPGRNDGDEHIGIDAVEEDLKQAVKRHEPRRIVGVPPGEFVPDNDHGNAACQAN